MRRHMRCLLAGFIGCLPLSCGVAPQEELALQDASKEASREALGEIEAATSATPATSTASPVEAAAGGCALGGPWLLELSVPVRWEANEQIEAGAGRVRLRATTARKAAGNLLIDGLTPCAMALPATERKSGARLRTKFSKRAFAKGSQTITPAITSMRDSAPGARFRMQPFALQYGAVIANPTMAPWPEDIVGNSVDVDGDGHPGVTIRLTSAEQVMVIDPVTHLFVAFRVVVRTAGGKLDSCDSMSGLGVVPNLGEGLAVNVSVMGCAKRSGAKCSEAEAEMAAAWLPTYLKDGNAAVQVTRMAEDTPGVCPAF